MKNSFPSLLFRYVLYRAKGRYFPWLRRRICGQWKPLFIALAFLSFFLTGEFKGWKLYQYGQLLTEDTWVRSKFQSEAKPSDLIGIVSIDHDDFVRRFSGRLPLDQSKLALLVGEVARRLSPKMIIVDLDTSDVSFSVQQISAFQNVPIVWARGVDDSSVSGSATSQAELVLGGGALPKGSSTGLAVTTLDLDWSVRKFPRWVDTTSRHYAKSLHFEVFCRLQSMGPRPDENCSNAIPGKNTELEVPLFERPPVYFPVLPAGEFLDGSGRAEACPQSSAVDANNFCRKIIVIGSDYSSSDRYKTPLGDQPGEKIVAAALDAEIKHGDTRFRDGAVTYALDIVLFLVLVLIHTTMRPIAALIMSGCVLAPVVSFGARIAYFATGYRVSVVALIISIVVDQVLSGAEQVHEQTERVSVLTLTVRRAVDHFKLLQRGALSLASDTQDEDLKQRAEALADEAQKYAATAHSNHSHHS